MSEPFVKDQAHRERIEKGEAILPSYPVTAEAVLAEIVTHWGELKRDEGAFPAGDRRAAMSEHRLWHSIQIAKAWLRSVDATGVAQAPMRYSPGRAYRQTFIDRAQAFVDRNSARYGDKVGHTDDAKLMIDMIALVNSLDAALEISYSVSSTDRSYPDPADRWDGWPDPPVTSRATPPVDNPLKAYTVEQLGFEIAKRVAVSSTHGEGGK